MIGLSGYKIQELLYESANSRVYRAVRRGKVESVILKVLKQDYPTQAELIRYRHEYEMIQGLACEEIIQAYALETYQKSLFIVLEDFGAESLQEVIQKQPLAIESFLELAIVITQALSQIHVARVIHKDINPSNIVFNHQTNALKIIDFGISTRISQVSSSLKHPDVLEGTLAYISPEQTGRMNRFVDYRTDFYSLGVTFYELLTQQLPFYSEDALELVHFHLAKQPPSPKEVNPAIPEMVADIILKLLQKNPEDRYQSAAGIQFDLEYCLEKWKAQGTIAPIALGSEDYVTRLNIPQKLYGRQQELETLLTAFDRIATLPEVQTQQPASPEMILVTGYSGLGKSALVREIYKPITEKRGYFVTGKFNQLQRTTPYSAIVAAFSDLVKQILTESQEALQQWQAKLLAALGNNGQIIVDVIPDIELVIGKQPAVPLLGATETQNRFKLIFQKLIRALSDPTHPLVIFLDDLQWADAGSLQLIHLMLTDREMRSLLLIGAYRNNEVSDTHPLTMALEELRSMSVPLTSIDLRPLTVEHLNQMLAESLRADRQNTFSLAELIHSKTNGNPFFASEFLKTLTAENLLHFDLKRRAWTWDVQQIQAQNITDNVVDLMMGKLQKLSLQTQQVLCFAACIGANFNLATLAIIGQQPAQEIFTALFPAVQAGLVLITSEPNEQLLIQNYRFLHDRVQQAAYALIPESQKQKLHLQIGQLLQQNLQSANGDEELFRIVDHLNIGRSWRPGTVSHLATDTEQLNLIQLNLRAARKAKESTAYQAAHSYLSIGLECLPIDAWTNQHSLTLALHQEQAEVEYLTGNFEASKQILDVILSHAQSVLSQAEAYNLLVVQSTLQTDYAMALEYGRRALGLLGIEFPASQFEQAFEQQYQQFKARLGDRPFSILLHQPDITQSEQQLAVKVLSNMGSAAYRYKQTIWKVVVVISISLFLEAGNVPESCYGYSNYGTLLGSVLNDYAMGYESCLVALQLSEKYQNLTQRSRVCFILSNFVHSWVQPVRLADAINQDGVRAGLESGEFQYVGYSLSYRISNLLFQGKPLNELNDLVTESLTFCRSVKNQWAIDVLLGYQIIFANLAGETADGLSFDPETLREADYLQACTDHKSFSALCRYFIAKALILYLHHQDDAAWICIEKALELQNYILGVISNADLHFYAALILLRSSLESGRDYQPQIAEHYAKLQHWSNSCPDNFQHKVWLLDAELGQLRGCPLEEILDRYDRSIAAAAAQGFLQDEAIAAERAADFWRSRQKPNFAYDYWQKACYTYAAWGAKRKAETLEREAEPLFEQRQSNAVPRSRRMTTTDRSSGQSLDLSTLLKASQAIASEIVLEKLLARLMSVLVENAGAQRGHLVLALDGKFCIEATSQVDGEPSGLPPLPLAEQVPLSIINYVFRTRKSVVLHRATEEEFRQDPYIQQAQPQSVLCLPLIYQGNLSGILYLENHLTAGAFTHDRLELLKVLSAQAAISLENARLYATLEQKVVERTQELAQEKALSERLLLNILPESVAERLKRQEQAIADGFDEVTVLFADIVGFTQVASHTPPQQLVKLLNQIFSQFDALCDRHKLEKIKTIGDAYLVVGGLPEPRPDHAQAIAQMALDMQTVIWQLMNSRSIPLPECIQQQGIAIRIGIHTGPVVAGVIGTKKFTYDLWGDTVNVASRMESHGKAGKIQVSATTYERLKGSYSFQKRGMIQVKGRGQIRTYWLLSPQVQPLSNE